MPRLFSYGTLQQEGVQMSTFGRLLHGQPDELVGFEQGLLRIEDPEFVAMSGKTDHAIVKFNGSNESRVRGTVFEVSDHELTSADRYEPAGYKRISTTLASGKRAWVYADGRPILSDTTIGVIGSGTERHEELAAEVGVLLATIGVNLLTGGGPGVMASVSRAFTETSRRTGICIGIIPSLGGTERATAKRGYPNPFVELAISTHLPLSGDRGTEEGSRNHINVLSSDGVIALPGSFGTLSEVSLALEYGKPIVAYARDLSSLEALPERVPRTRSLADVESFVRNICYANANDGKRRR